MLDAVVFGQYVPGSSFLHRLDPRTKVLAVLAVGGAALAAGSWGELLMASLPAAAAVLCSRLPVRLFAGALKPLKYILALAFVVQALTCPGGEVLLAAGRLQVTAGGLLAGAQMLLKVLVLLIAASALTFTTPPTRMTAALEALLSPLRRLGVPVHELSLTATIALRFIPVLFTEAQVLLKAQRSRGAGAAGRGPGRYVHLLVPFFVPLFAGAIRRAEELAVAMEARCYRSGANRTRLLTLRMGGNDYAVLALLAALLLGTIFWC